MTRVLIVFGIMITYIGTLHLHSSFIKAGSERSKIRVTSFNRRAACNTTSRLNTIRIGFLQSNEELRIAVVDLVALIIASDYIICYC